jgi:hypothetical protein
MSEWRVLGKVMARSLAMPLREWETSLRIALPFLVLMLVNAVLAVLQPYPDGLDAAPLVIAGLGLAILVWMSFAWHRAILGDRAARPGHSATVFLRFLGYLGVLLLLAILSVSVSAVLIALVEFLFLQNVFVVGWVAIALFLSLFVIGIAFYRLSLLLPAIAIGRPIGLRAVWRATRGASGVCLVVFLLMLAGVSSMIAIELGAAQALPVWALVLFAYLWRLVVVILNASFLTTLYEHYVLDRFGLRQKDSGTAAATTSAGKKTQKSLGAQLFTVLRYLLWFVLFLIFLGFVAGFLATLFPAP